MKKIILLVLCSVLSTVAYAGGKKKVSTYGSSASRYLDAEVEAVRGDAKDIAAARREFDRLMGESRDAARSAQEESTALQALETKQASFEETRRTLELARIRLDNTNPQDKDAIEEVKALIKDQEGKLATLQGEVDKARETAAKKKGASEEAQRQADAAKAVFEQKNGKLTAEMRAVLEATNGKPTDEQIASALGSQVRSAAATRAADELYEDMEKNTMDAELILTNFDRLKADLKGDEEKLKALKARFGTRLDNTLLGQYVNDKIDAKVCSAMDKCTQRAANPVVEAVQQAAQGDGGAKKPAQQVQGNADGVTGAPISGPGN